MNNNGTSTKRVDETPKGTPIDSFHDAMTGFSSQDQKE